MRKYRFYIADDLAVDAEINLDADLSHYISRVLRLNTEDTIFLFNNTNCEYQAVLKDVKRSTSKAYVISKLEDNNQTAIDITLAQVLAKGDKMDLIIQKATELGVSKIVPLFSERTVIRNIADRIENKMEHWQKVAIAACCQSWRNNLPTIESPQSLKSWLASCKEGCNLILSPSDNAERLRNLSTHTKYTILIGPEGGFAPDEISAAKQYNFIPINLGPRILRTETAGLACIAAIQALYGDS